MSRLGAIAAGELKGTRTSTPREAGRELPLLNPEPLLAG
jgi:hypothetical protein